MNSSTLREAASRLLAKSLNPLKLVQSYTWVQAVHLLHPI
jgi:hypothetical protein